MKIHKGDTAKIISGKDRGKIGKVSKVDSKTNLLIMEGLNLFKKHQRPRRRGEKGEVINIARPLDASKVSLVCPNCKNPARIGYRLGGETGSRRKIRYCKKCNSPI